MIIKATALSYEAFADTPMAQDRILHAAGFTTQSPEELLSNLEQRFQGGELSVDELIALRQAL